MLTHTQTHTYAQEKRERRLAMERRMVDKGSKETIRWEEKDSDR